MFPAGITKGIVSTKSVIKSGKDDDKINKRSCVGRDTIMNKKRFAEIHYNRPDYTAYAQRIAKYALEIRGANTMNELSNALESFFTDRVCVETMETVAFIRCYQDCTDRFYQEEMQYTQTQAAMTDLSPIYDALLASPYRDAIDDKFGRQFLRKIEKELALGKNGLELLGREQELIAQYQGMISAMRFTYEGKEISSAELSKYKESRDLAARKSAREAARKAFAAKSEEFLNVLKELVEVRGRIARANGYASYLEYANMEKGRYSYGEKELASLCRLVRRELVPLKKRLYMEFKKRLGLTRYTADDTGIYFESGNPAPLGDAGFLLEQASRMYGQMDRDFSALFETMRSGGYFDCARSDHKITGMGFCTEIYTEKLPFIFGNCTGRHSDVDILVHEFGHAIQMKQSMDRFSVPEYWEMPNDLSEIPSKVMEQFSYEYAPLFFGERAGQFVETHLITVLQEICSFCMTHEFETFLYSADTFQPETAIAEYNRLTEIYDAGIDYSVCRNYMDAGALLVQDKGVYMFPRYLVSYALSDISAVSMRLIYESDREKGLAVYKKLCGMGGSMEYNEAVNTLGLPLPYTEEAVVAVRDYLAEKLALS